VAVNLKKELITQVGERLETMLAEQVKAFPKEFNQTRFLQNCLAVLADTKDIEKCRPMSVVRSLIKGAYLNLDFFRKECYVIPYNNNIGTKEKPEWVKDAQFQTDYKGERKLCLTYGKGIKDIYAKLVQEGDFFEIGVDSGVQYVNFKPLVFNDAATKGAFAVILMENGSTRYETMSVKELEDVRKNYSKIPDSPAYQKSLGEMYKKIVMRRACKLVDLHFDNHEQEKAYEEGGDADFSGTKPEAVIPKVEDPFKNNEVKSLTTDAVLVEGEDSLINQLRKKYPGEETWQLEARLKEGERP
jgi:recombination protein RecT